MPSSSLARCVHVTWTSLLTSAGERREKRSQRGVRRVHHRQGVGVVVVSDQLEDELAGRGVGVEDALDVVQNLGDERLRLGLADPYDAESERLVKERLRGGGEAGVVNRGRGEPEAPGLIDQALADDVRRVHVERVRQGFLADAAAIAQAVRGERGKLPSGVFGRAVVERTGSG